MLVPNDKSLSVFMCIYKLLFDIIEMQKSLLCLHMNLTTLFTDLQSVFQRQQKQSQILKDSVHLKELSNS